VADDTAADEHRGAGADWAEDGAGVAVAVGCVAGREQVEAVSMDKHDLAMALFKGQPHTDVPDMEEFKEWITQPEQEQFSKQIADRAQAVHMFHPRAIGDVLKILVEAYEQFKASKV